MAQFLDLGLASSDLRVVRRAASISFLFSFFARADSGVVALRSDVSVTARGVEFREHGKNIERVHPATLVLPWSAGGEAHSERSVAALMAKFLRMSDAAWGVRRGGERELWRLPSDPSPRTPLSSDIIGTWLTECLAESGVTPPLGQKWTRHSMRSGGATSALAIGADAFTIARWGVWNSLNSVILYVDPLVQACPSAVLFFRHLLKPSLEHILRLTGSSLAGSREARRIHQYS